MFHPKKTEYSVFCEKRKFPYSFMIKIFFKHTYVEGPSVLRQILLTFTLPISQILDGQILLDRSPHGIGRVHHTLNTAYMNHKFGLAKCLTQNFLYIIFAMKIIFSPK